MQKKWVFPIALGAVVVAGVIWLVTAGGGGGAGPAPTPTELAEVLQAVEADPAAGMSIGPADAPVVIEEFFDPSCPFCATFSGFTGKLIRQNYVENPDATVRWVAYDYFVGFPNSVAASLAARCAGEQGMYWPVHDLLLARQTRWYQQPDPGGAISQIVSEAGVSPEPYNECMRERRHIETLAASHQVAISRGVNSTPTIFVDGVRVDLRGVEPYTHIEGLIQARLDAAP